MNGEYSQVVEADYVITDGTRNVTMGANVTFYNKEFTELIKKAVELSKKNIPDIEAIHMLGEGWVAEETLAISIYCALKYQDDFKKAIISAVNHKGDSDSTGAVTGNILGAYLGLSAIPDEYLDKLELKDVIIELADDLFMCGNVDLSFLSSDVGWIQKYVDRNYKPK
jgi:ADP-ribosylglycohydrolase